MAENNFWSSGECKPGPQVLVSEETDPVEIDFEKYYDESKIYKDAYFYPSIKDFEGTYQINPTISISGKQPTDYFNHFCDPDLLQMIMNETNRYKTQNPI